MADEPASDDTTAAPRRVSVVRRLWSRVDPNIAMVVGCVVLFGVIALDVYFIHKDDEGGAAPSATVASLGPSSAPSTSAAPAPLPALAMAVPAVPSGSPADPALGADFEGDDGETGKTEAAPPAPKRYSTVQQAAAESCTTASVAGLSRQIIAQARCIKPNAFVPLPSRPNLTVEDEVFPYLHLEARNDLVKALDSKPKQKMTINSALRTLAQQYLVWRWSATKRCGVPLATPPGESNHETGTALDIAEASTWRPVLEKRNFKWLGASDRVHFDHKTGKSASTSTDVLAFQRLWNRNHPDDKLKEDGRYTPLVEQRLKKSPPEGFKLGASCGK